MVGGRQEDPGGLEQELTFFTLVRSDLDDWHARLLIRSLRAFGGSYRACTVLVFTTQPDAREARENTLHGVEYVPLDVDPALQNTYFANKVLACAEAERRIACGHQSMVWMGSRSIITAPPCKFSLHSEADIAIRPVHHQNIGLLAQQALDPFWRGVYDCVGLQAPPYSVESYVDSLSLMPYFNTHLFVIDPSIGLMGAWLEHFSTLALDPAFQTGPCADEAHRVFLHQAVLSALIAGRLEEDRVRILPPTYSYPLHMHGEVSEAIRPRSLNELHCPVYEGVFAYPSSMGALKAYDPLHSWLLGQGSATL